MERRDEDLTTGLDRLRRCASEAVRSPLDDFCDTLLAGQLAVDGNDDVAMVGLRVPGAG